METTFDKITTRWPELVESNTGDITFYHQLYKLLRAEEGHEMAASMCHALLDVSLPETNQVHHGPNRYVGL